MIDIITLKLGMSYIPPDYLSFLKNHLKRQKLKNPDNRFICQGKFENFNISLTKQGLKIKGSLPAYVFGNNQATLVESEVHEVIQELSKDLKVPLVKSDVLALGLAENIVTNSPPTFYLEMFKNYTDHIGRNAYAFDEIKSQNTRNINITGKLFGRHVLRYVCEYPKQNSVAQFLGLPKPLLSDVLVNYEKFVGSWVEVFNTIYQQNQVLTIQPDVVKQKGGFKTFVKKYGLQAMGGADEAIKLIMAAKSQGMFKYSDSATNEIKWIETLRDSDENLERTVLANELAAKIKAMAGLQNTNQLVKQLMGHPLIT